MGWLRRAFENLVHSGEHFEIDPRRRRRVVLNNTLAFILVLDAFSYVQPLWALGLKRLGLSLIPVGLLYAVPIVLNRVGRLTASRILLTTLPSCIVFFYFSAIGLRGEVSLLYAAACVPVVLSGLEHRKTLAFGTALALGLALVVFLAGPAYMGPPRLQPHAELILRLIIMVGTFLILLAIVLSFVISNARAERKLAHAHADVQRLLDSVDQGFVILDPSGCIETQRSAAFDAWFGAPAPGTSFADCLKRLDQTTGELFECGWSQVGDDILPIELLLDQMPAKMQAGARYFKLFYKPDTNPAGKLENVMVG